MFANFQRCHPHDTTVAVVVNGTLAATYCSCDVYCDVFGTHECGGTMSIKMKASNTLTFTWFYIYI